MSGVSSGSWRGHCRTIAALGVVAILVGCGGPEVDPVAVETVDATRAPDHSEGPPKRLEIPRLDVDATVLALGKAEDGSQEVPKALDDTGWWRHGSKPGEPGNTVIVGHTASKDDGVFDDLGTLRRGDRIAVRTRDGARDYRVTGTEEVAVENFASASDSIYRETGPSGLVLLTCGDWNGRDYDTTVIVRADIVR